LLAALRDDWQLAMKTAAPAIKSQPEETAVNSDIAANFAKIKSALRGQ
jgi:hypothetical protein